MVKFFVNATQLLLSSGENSDYELNVVKFFVSETQLLLSSSEISYYELNYG